MSTPPWVRPAPLHYNQIDVRSKVIRVFNYAPHFSLRSKELIPYWSSLTESNTKVKNLLKGCALGTFLDANTTSIYRNHWLETKERRKLNQIEHFKK